MGEWTIKCFSLGQWQIFPIYIYDNVRNELVLLGLNHEHRSTQFASWDYHVKIIKTAILTSST